MTCEVLAIVGGRPWLLERLALIGVARGQPKEAHLFLEALTKDVIYGAKARHYLAQLDADPTLSDVPEVTRLRALIPRSDEAGPLSYRELFEMLLRQTDGNRMAFEYLMAQHLLRGDLERIAADVHWLVDLGYNELPRLYAEALLLYSDQTGRNVTPAGHAISAQTRARFDWFRGASAAGRAPPAGYSTSYFQYYVTFIQRAAR
jgi:hypothetical protein